MIQSIFKVTVLLIIMISSSCKKINNEPLHEKTTQEEIPHYLRKDNFTIVRLIIQNSENKILMVGGDNWWGMPWVNLTKRQFMKEAIDSLAFEIGIELSDIEFKGQFCFKYDYKPNVTFRNYYMAKYKSGDIKLPRNTIEDEFVKVEWVEKEESLNRIGNKGIEKITRQILSNPEHIWGGSFIVSHTDDDHPTVMVEDFYQL